MKLTVFGSTGGTGREIVRQALEQGHEVTAFARTPEKLTQTHERLHVVKGDVLGYSAVENAVRGQDAVLCSLGSPAGDTSYLRANGTKNIVLAMEKTGVGRFVCQSSNGVGDSVSTLPFIMRYLIVPLILRRTFADHQIQEEYVTKSQLDWVLVRPVALVDGEHTGMYQHGYAGENKTVTFKISRADTADFMLKQVVDDTYLRRKPNLSY